MGKRGDKAKKQMILDTLSDLVTDFLYYDRKEDEDLPVDSIQEAIGQGVITVDELVSEFRSNFEDI